MNKPEHAMWWRRAVALVLASVALFALVQETRGGTIVIDDFSDPVPPAMMMVSGGQVGGVLIKQGSPSILGGERDVLLDLLGGSSGSTATMLIGGGVLDLSTGMFGSTLSLQYDGFGPGDNDSAAGLFNQQNLAIDLTDGGENQFFQFDFLSLDAGPGMDAIDLVIEVTSTAGTATYMGALNESLGPASYLFNFDDFQTTVGFDWQDVTGLTFVLNAGGQQAVDFVVDGISVVVAEPAALLMALPGCAAIALSTGNRRRRRRLRSA